jgi:hypothetical protein
VWKGTSSWTRRILAYPSLTGNDASFGMVVEDGDTGVCRMYWAGGRYVCTYARNKVGMATIMISPVPRPG